MWWAGEQNILYIEKEWVSQSVFDKKGLALFLKHRKERMEKKMKKTQTNKRNRKKNPINWKKTH